MIDLTTCDVDAIDTFGKSLLMANRTSLHSFEEAASVCVKAIYNEFRQKNSQNSFALVRIYRLCRYPELLPELQKIADPNISHWMALMGTIGSQLVWCDRRTSRDHKVIQAVGNRSPMLTAAFQQIGLEPSDSTKATASTSLVMQDATLFTKYFHVPQALGSPFIPAQRDFVEVYDIQSVVGIGSAFVSNSSYLALCFSKIPISEENARKFADLSAFVSTLLALYDVQGALWMS